MSNSKSKHDWKVLVILGIKRGYRLWKILTYYNY